MPSPSQPRPPTARGPPREPALSARQRARAGACRRCRARIGGGPVMAASGPHRRPRSPRPPRRRGQGRARPPSCPEPGITRPDSPGWVSLIAVLLLPDRQSGGPAPVTAGRPHGPACTSWRPGAGPPPAISAPLLAAVKPEPARWRLHARPDLTRRAESSVDAAGPGRKASRTSRSARKTAFVARYGRSAPSAAARDPRRPRHPRPARRPKPRPARRRHGDQQQPARRPWPVPGTARLRAEPRQHRLARPRHRAADHPGPPRARRDYLAVLPGPAPRLPVRGQVQPRHPGRRDHRRDRSRAQPAPVPGRPGPGQADHGSAAHAQKGSGDPR